MSSWFISGRPSLTAYRAWSITAALISGCVATRSAPASAQWISSGYGAVTTDESNVWIARDAASSSARRIRRPRRRRPRCRRRSLQSPRPLRPPRPHRRRQPHRRPLRPSRRRPPRRRQGRALRRRDRRPHRVRPRRLDGLGRRSEYKHCDGGHRSAQMWRSILEAPPRRTICRPCRGAFAARRPVVRSRLRAAAAAGSSRAIMWSPLRLRFSRAEAPACRRMRAQSRRSPPTLPLRWVMSSARPST